MGGGVQGLNVPTAETFNNLAHGFIFPSFVNVDEGVLEHVKGYLAYLGGKKDIESVFDQFSDNLDAHVDVTFVAQVFVVVEIFDLHGVLSEPDDDEIGALPKWPWTFESRRLCLSRG